MKGQGVATFKKNTAARQPFRILFRSDLLESFNLLSVNELRTVIRECILNKRESQKKLYNSFYSYGMSICDRYTKREEDSIEVFNDAFLKIFKEIHRFKPSYTDEVSSFKGWVRKIMIHTAIDYNRKHHKHAFTSDMDKTIIYIPAGGEDALDMISYDEIIIAIRELSPAYRTVLNMFIIDGLSHEEISNHLQIAVGTSKSNLSKAKQQLQKILKKDNLTPKAKNVG